MATIKFKDINTDMFTSVIMNASMTSTERSSAIGEEVSRSIRTVHQWLVMFELTMIGDWADAVKGVNGIALIFADKFSRYRQTFNDIYAGMTRITITPTTDTATRVKTHEGSDGSMAENSPINASIDDINTPYVKAKGVNRYTDEEIVTNDNVDEALQRIRALNEYRTRIHDIVQSCIYACCDELTTGY